LVLEKKLSQYLISYLFIIGNCCIQKIVIVDSSTCSFFKGRTLVIATMHGKEKVIAPLFEQSLGVKTIVPSNFDTDYFGTFSGTKRRVASPVEAALFKCKAALALTGETLAIASEGSFGPHPVVGFIPANEEILVLIDTQYTVEIKAKSISFETNFNGKQCYTIEQVVAFAEKCSFPSHGIILKKEKDVFDGMESVIGNWEKLKQLAASFLQQYPSLYVETDMRAMNNPSRMKVIEQTVKELLQKINTPCPQCHIPGFDITKVIDGLICSLCGKPTASTFAYEYGCSKCGYRLLKKYPHNQETEDPMYCAHCNP
jgi:hypothetical protein